MSKDNSKVRIILVAVMGQAIALADALRATAKNKNLPIIIAERKDGIDPDIDLLKLTNNFPIRGGFNLEALMMNPLEVTSVPRTTAEETERSIRQNWEDKNKNRMKHMLTVGKHQVKAPHKHLF